MITWYVIGAAFILFLVVLTLVFRGRKNDKYDFDGLSSPGAAAELQTAEIQTAENHDLLERIRRSLGIKNFRDVTKQAGDLIKQGRKSEAIQLLKNNTPLDDVRILKIMRLFEMKFHGKSGI